MESESIYARIGPFSRRMTSVQSSTFLPILQPRLHIHPHGMCSALAFSPVLSTSRYTSLWTLLPVSQDASTFFIHTSHALSPKNIHLCTFADDRRQTTDDLTAKTQRSAKNAKILLVYRRASRSHSSAQARTLAWCGSHACQTDSAQRRALRWWSAASVAARTSRTVSTHREGGGSSH